jgi:hypothetical protein
MLNEMGVIRPALKRTLDRLKDIPTDIEPIFVTAEELVPAAPSPVQRQAPVKRKAVKKRTR